MLPSLSLKVIYFPYGKFIQEKNTLRHVIFNAVARLDRDTTPCNKASIVKSTLYRNCVCNIYTSNCVANIG